jgi:O-antigen ligase
VSAAVLTALLFFGILTVSASGRWAVSILDAGLFALALVWAVRLIAQPYTLRGGPLLALLACAAAWPLVQLAAGTSVYRFETWNAAPIWAAHLAVFFLALQLFGDGALRRRFLRTLLWFGTAIAAISLVQLFTSGGRIFWLFPSPYKDLVLGPFVYRNNYAAFIELVVPLALLEPLERPRAALGWYAAAALMAASVVAGGSRAGTVLVLLEMAAILALDLRRVAPGAVLKVAAATAILAAIAGPGYLLSRFQETDPLAVRRELVESSLAMVRDRPLLGFGLGAWPTAYPAYALFDLGMHANHAHCDWAEWAAEGGLPFAALAAALACGAFVLSTRRRWGLGVAAVFLHALVDYPFQKPALAALAFALLGALAADARRRYPLMTPMGRSRATLRARPASDTTSITASTSL